MFWRRRLTLLEMGLYAGLVSLVLAAFFERAIVLMEQAERMAMETTVTNVNASLALGSARALLEARSSAPPSLLTEMAGSPNFAGAIRASELGGIARGQWAYDSSSGELIYLPRLHRGLTVEDPESALRFRLNQNGKNYKLVPTATYIWQ
jgi:hypothetical protein